MVGVEAGGHGNHLGEHAARFLAPRVGVFQGARTYVLQDDNGQISTTHSISAGLDYSAIGPEHALLHDVSRVQYVSVSDERALEGFQLLSRLEGIIPALESAHAIAYLPDLVRLLDRDAVIVVNLSGRGDKDVDSVTQFINLHAPAGERMS
jgi:tryptophan synthase beta chain